MVLLGEFSGFHPADENVSLEVGSQSIQSHLFPVGSLCLVGEFEDVVPQPPIPADLSRT